MNESENSFKDIIQVRMLTQYAYCKRLAYMEWVQGEFAYNADVLEGKYQHRNVDVVGGGGKTEEDVKMHARSVTLSDQSLGLVGKMDLLEIEGDNATPVEYKHGKVPDTPEKAHLDHMVQLAAQCILLRANGYKCTKGIIYYIASKRRIEVSFDDNIISTAKKMIGEMREMAAGARIPPPLVDSPKCPRCSLVGICLPDETNMLSGVIRGDDSDGIRRMYPIRNDSWPVYVQEQGAYVSLSGDSIIIKTPSDEKTKVRLIDVAELVILGNCQVTTQAIRKMSERNIPVMYLTYGGWFTGMVSGISHKNIELRMMQHDRHRKKTASMAIARQIVYGKIKNCITMLRRNHVSCPKQVIADMDDLAKKAQTIKAYDSLLGIEGMAARLYFSEFNGMISKNDMKFRFTERNRRPPKDPINAILSFLYSMLVRQAVTIITGVGLDPYLGFLHMPKYGKPALALDMIEEFRPIVADSTCITLVNNNMIRASDITYTGFGVNLNSDGRRKVIKAYEQRMDDTIKHSVLGYTVSYRRVMETQVRLLARHITDEIPKYPTFKTR